MFLYSSINFSSVELYGYLGNIYSLFLGFKTIHRTGYKRGANIGTLPGAYRDGVTPGHEPKLRVEL